MSRLLFYVLVGFGGCGLLLDGGVHGRPVEYGIGLGIALAVQVLLATGWWLRWERSTSDPYGAATAMQWDYNARWEHNPASYPIRVAFGSVCPIIGVPDPWATRREDLWAPDDWID